LMPILWQTGPYRARIANVRRSRLRTKLSYGHGQRPHPNSGERFHLQPSLFLCIQHDRHADTCTPHLIQLPE
jgi:hypothetical protein